MLHLLLIKQDLIRILKHNTYKLIVYFNKSESNIVNIFIYLFYQHVFKNFRN